MHILYWVISWSVWIKKWREIWTIRNGGRFGLEKWREPEQTLRRHGRAMSLVCSYYTNIYIYAYIHTYIWYVCSYTEPALSWHARTTQIYTYMHTYIRIFSTCVATQSPASAGTCAKAGTPRVERSSKNRRRDDVRKLAFTGVLNSPTRVSISFYYFRSNLVPTGPNVKGRFRLVVSRPHTYIHTHMHTLAAERSTRGISALQQCIDT
jgi:hypothetical protein